MPGGGADVPAAPSSSSGPSSSNQPSSSTALAPAGAPPPLPPTHGAVVSLDGLQLAAINSRLFELQASSGAQVVLSPGGPGSFNLLLSGHPHQVEQAQLVLASLLAESLGGVPVAAAAAAGEVGAPRQL